MKNSVFIFAMAAACMMHAAETYPLADFLEQGVKTRPGQCLMNLAGITSAGLTIPGAAAVERQGLGDGYQTKWGLEIGHLREGANCIYRGFNFSTPEARALEFHVSSDMQDSCMELYDADERRSRGDRPTDADERRLAGTARPTLLGTVFCPYTAGWKKYQTVKFTLPDSAAGLENLKVRFRHAKKEDRPGGARLSCPPPDIVPGGAMVVVQRRNLKPSHVYTYHVEGLSKGGGLYVADFAKGEVRRLVDATDGIVLDAQVSYDGKQILFSWKRTMSESFAIWRINADDTGLQKIISGPCNNQNACWLPDGGIAFTSDRKPAFAYCWTSTSPVLYRADGDGKNVVRLSANYLTDFTPSVMGDGRILFSRWEYVDRPAIPIQSLWAIQPDGTGLSGVFGNRVLSPATFMFAYDVPGRPNTFLCIMTSHNGPCSGAVGLIDVSLGGNAQKAIRNLTPEVKVPPVEDGIRGNGVRGPYTTTYPVDRERYLVSKGGEIQLRHFDSDAVRTLLLPDRKSTRLNSSHAT